MTETTIRPAQQSDATDLAVLVDIAHEGIPNWVWRTKAAPYQSAFEVGRQRAAREDGGFSYRKADVGLIDGRVAGMILHYRLDDPFETGDLSGLPEAVAALIRLEAKVPGSWYVNAVATYPEYRGKGLGRMLLNRAEEKAHAAGADRLSIIVADHNTGAAALYIRNGYRPVDRAGFSGTDSLPLSGEWILMTKPVGG